MDHETLTFRLELYKQLTVWMKSQNVGHFKLNELEVSFAPHAFNRETSETEIAPETDEQTKRAREEDLLFYSAV